MEGMNRLWAKEGGYPLILSDTNGIKGKKMHGNQTYVPVQWNRGGDEMNTIAIKLPLFEPTKIKQDMYIEMRSKFSRGM